MDARRLNVNLPYIETRNYEHKARIRFYREQLALIDSDPHRKERLAVQECMMCYKSSRIGGVTFTFRQCAHCEEILNSGNTNVDVLCQGCAKKAQLCKHCGADIDLKNRRKREMPKT